MTEENVGQDKGVFHLPGPNTIFNLISTPADEYNCDYFLICVVGAH